MNLQERKEMLVWLGNFIGSDDEDWQRVKQKATAENPWFIPEFIELSVSNIRSQFLKEEELQGLIDKYRLSDNAAPKRVGIVMAGNIPLVGFHDLLCTFLSGHYSYMKPSSKDAVLIEFLVEKMKAHTPKAAPYFVISEMLKGCDAYIATGSNNSSHYFEYYFGRYPHIIRKNRTSVALLTGEETDDELNALADDVYQYFGLGCRNVTKVFVPRNYNFEQLLNTFKKYNYLINHNKYKNNYDYNLAIHLLNHTYYMSNESLIMIESPTPFSPIGQLNFEYYDNIETVKTSLENNGSIQCIVGSEATRFGEAQTPALCDFADGVDTMKFLGALS